MISWDTKTDGTELVYMLGRIVNQRVSLSPPLLIKLVKAIWKKKFHTVREDTFLLERGKDSPLFYSEFVDMVEITCRGVPTLCLVDHM